MQYTDGIKIGNYVIMLSFENNVYVSCISTKKLAMREGTDLSTFNTVSNLSTRDEMRLVNDFIQGKVSFDQIKATL